MFVTPSMLSPALAAGFAGALFALMAILLLASLIAATDLETWMDRRSRSRRLARRR